MQDSLSIRSYTKSLKRHAHHYHQIVLPINGYIDIDMPQFCGKIRVGEAIVIHSGQEHGFKAHEQSRFIVADLTNLPGNLQAHDICKVRLEKPIMAFLTYVELQLQDVTSLATQEAAAALLMQLLAQHVQLQAVDKRIEPVLALIHQDLAGDLSVKRLAEVACLGETQFKKRFKLATGKAIRQYVTELRMHKAQSLLTHTDMPVSVVANAVGYADFSAFSRRFKETFSRSPKHFSNRA